MRPGTRLGLYEIRAPLGAGGMGEVYRARDTKLDRDVAIKVLPTDFATDPERLARFEREAKLLASLNHPNIATVHAFDESEGVRFIAMELVEGESLTDLIPSGGLPLDHFFRIAVPLADAVAAAHGKGVTHRDLKPANVMVGEGGRTKVLDFGLAKHAEGPQGPSSTRDATDLLTGVGSVVGTYPYMAPEQLEGKSADPRSDIFSLGVLLYEMATGTRPFAGDSPASLVSSILRDEPRSLTEIALDAPRQLARIVHHCLAKDPEQRFQSALDVRNQLAELERETQSAPGSPRAGAEVPSGAARAGAPRWQRFAPMAVAAIVLATAAGAWWAWTSPWDSEPGGTGTASSAARTIAVLPFESDDPEQDHLANGLAEELLRILAQSEDLTVIEWRSSRAAAAAGLGVDEIGRRLGVAFLLDGSVRRSGERLRITPRLVEVGTSRLLWSEQFEETVSDIFEIEDRITAAVASELAVRLTPTGRAGARSTTSEEAHNLYFRGREAFLLGDEPGLLASIDYYRQVLDLDPNYALAWSGIAESYIFLADAYMAPLQAYGRAEDAARRALALEEVPAARAALGFASVPRDWNWDSIMRETDLALARNPSLAIAHMYRAWPFLLANEPDAAVRSVDRAITLDPLFPFSEWVKANTLLLARRYEEAVQSEARISASDPSFFYVESWGAAALRALGDNEGALEIYERILGDLGQQPLPGLAITHARMGRTDEALAIAAALEAESERRSVSPFTLAWIHAALGDRDRMLHWLYRAQEMGDVWVIFTVGIEDFDPYRRDPDYQELQERFGLAEYPWSRAARAAH